MTEKTIQLSEDAPAQAESHPLGAAYRQGDLVTIFERGNEWLFVIHGVGSGGLVYESEDHGGFASPEEAEAAARKMYENSDAWSRGRF